MKTSGKFALAALIAVMFIPVSGRADEVAGKVADTSFGAFMLDDAGTLKQFNLSARNTVYEPTTWRPTAGDEIQVTYTPIQNRRGATVLAVDTAMLVKAGPHTLTDLASPIEVEITETGRSGIRGKIPSGQIVRFAYDRGVQRLPAGWVPVVGEKVRVTFRLDADRGFTVGYWAQSLEKLP
jgi:hypothetical protein